MTLKASGKIRWPFSILTFEPLSAILNERGTANQVGLCLVI